MRMHVLRLGVAKLNLPRIEAISGEQVWTSNSSIFNYFRRIRTLANSGEHKLGAAVSLTRPRLHTMEPWLWGRQLSS